MKSISFDCHQFTYTINRYTSATKSTMKSINNSHDFAETTITVKESEPN